MKKLLLSIFVLATVASSCKKDKEEVPIVYPEENFYSAFLVQTGFNQKTETIGSTYEMGYTFKPIVNGNINSLVVKLASATSTVRITIWDATTRAILRTETVNALSTNIEKTFLINAFSLEKNKTYCISMNTRNLFKRSKNDYSPVNYPITIGNISVRIVNYKNGSSQEFPDVTNDGSILGDLSFNFQQTP